MTTHLRYAIACAAGGLTLSVCAVVLALHRSWLALAFCYGAAILTWGARSEARLHRRRLDEHDLARRRAEGENVPALDPCCLLARASNGKAHDHQCTLPGSAAHVLQADDAGLEREAYERLTAQLQVSELDDGESPFGWRTGGRA